MMLLQPRNHASVFGRYPKWLVILGAWALLVLFTSTRSLAPELNLSWAHSLRVAAGQWLVWLLFIPSIIWIDRNLPTPRDALVRRFLFHVPLSLISSAATNYVTPLVVQLTTFDFKGWPDPVATLLHSLRTGFQMHVMIYWAIVGVYSAYEYNIRLNERKVRNAELERLVSESQLQTLRSQINPHFLFNTLNAISAYVEGNPRMARRMLEQLGGLLRTAFDFDKLQEIPLDRDLAFLKRYLALQQVRYDERLEVLLTAAPDTLDALVPAFILQPLIENAINHGIAKQSEKGLIEVSAWREDGRLRLRVRDDGPGLPPSWDVATSVGVGIGNTRERLRFLYGAAGHSFQISNREDRSGVEVNLILPLRLPEQRAADPLVDESYQHSRR